MPPPGGAGANGGGGGIAALPAPRARLLPLLDDGGRRINAALVPPSKRFGKDFLSDGEDGWGRWDGARAGKVRRTCAWRRCLPCTWRQAPRGCPGWRPNGACCPPPPAPRLLPFLSTSVCCPETRPLSRSACAQWRSWWGLQPMMSGTACPAGSASPPWMRVRPGCRVQAGGQGRAGRGRGASRAAGARAQPARCGCSGRSGRSAHTSASTPPMLPRALPPIHSPARSRPRAARIRRAARHRAHPPPVSAPPTDLCTSKPAVARELHGSAMLPAIWFIFSRRDCDLAARHLELHGLQLTSPEGAPCCLKICAVCRAVLFAELCCAVLCCAVLCCAVLCCAVLCCAVLCCAVLCCAVLCCAVPALQSAPPSGPSWTPCPRHLLTHAPTAPACLPACLPCRARRHPGRAGRPGGGAARGGQGGVRGGAAAGRGRAPRRLPARLEGAGGAPVPAG